MTLIKSLNRHFLFALAAFFLLSGNTYAKKYKLSGQVLSPDQEGVKGAEIAFVLDGDIEKEIQTSLKNISMGSTTLVIAHRLSTIVDADEILVLNHGEIQERGQHSSLLKLDGLYADLWRRQQDTKN